MFRTAAAAPTPRRRRTRALAALVAVLVGLLGATLTAAPAQATSGFSGTLVDQHGDPVLGLEFIIHENDGSSSGIDHHVTSSTTDGTFSLTGLADDAYYLIIGDNPITGAYHDTNGDFYDNFGGGFYFLPGDEVIGTLVLNKLVPVSGTIANWTLPMGDLHVQVKADDGSGHWTTVSSGDSNGATFSIPTAVEDGNYTLYFQLPSTSTAPFLDAFLGGEFFDPSLATPVPGTAGTPITGISMTMPDAAFISGTVTDAVTGDGIPDIDVSTEDRPGEQFFTDELTDSNGDYTLRVIPGLTYAVYADDPNGVYDSLTYDNLDPCGCVFTPVTPTIPVPSSGIDFSLTTGNADYLIEGLLLDGSLSGTPVPFDNVQVHLYSPVPGGWSEVDVAQSDSSGDFEVHLPALGSYRLRFELAGTWLPVIDGYVGQGSAGSPDPATPGCVVDTGPLDASSVSSSVAYFVLAGLNDAGGCAAEPVPSGSPGGGHSSGGHRSHPATTTDTVLPVAIPTPTPSATPSPSESPSEDATPSPQPTSPATTSTGLDLTWLWILIVIALALIVAFFLIVFLRRRRD